MRPKNGKLGLATTQSKCTESLLDHTRYFFRKNHKRKYKVRYHHKLIAAALEDVMCGKIRRLAISVAPRLGKTELAVIQFIGHSLALNPQAKFILLSASDSLAQENSESIKNYIKSPEYQKRFPQVKIKPGTDSKKKWYTTAGGGVYALGAAGQLTGFGAGLSEGDDDEEEWEVYDEFATAMADRPQPLARPPDLDPRPPDKSSFGGAIVYDDPMKPEDGNSEVIRNKINRRYVSTVKNRVNSRRTPIIIIAQRLHKHDLIGYVQEIEGNAASGGDWTTLVIPELYADSAGEMCCLDETIRTVADLQEMENSPDDEVRFIFQTQHQQNPQTREGLMFPAEQLNWYDPAQFNVLAAAEYVFQVIDPADTGADNLSAPYIAVVGKEFYVFDVIFNRNETTYNEPLLLANIPRYNVKRLQFEAQPGWRIMMNNLRSQVSAARFNCEVYGFLARDNKHTRILAQHGFIKNRFFFRSDWKTGTLEYRAFVTELTGYLINQSSGGNTHDDAPDSMAMAAHIVQTDLKHLVR